MRHFVFRLLIGLIWLGAAVAGALRGELVLAAVYAVLGVVFLWSACSAWKRDRDGGR